MATTLKLIFVSVLSLFLFSCGDDDEVTTDEVLTIAEEVAEKSNFKLLEMALKDTDLFAALNASGTFTLFAPTDMAFEALLKELGVEYAEIPKETLTEILQMHVLGSVQKLDDFKDDSTLQTLQEEITLKTDAPISITDPNGRVSTVGLTDLAASNGVIHVIDKVILPKQ